MTADARGLLQAECAPRAAPQGARHADSASAPNLFAGLSVGVHGFLGLLCVAALSLAHSSGWLPAPHLQDTRADFAASASVVGTRLEDASIAGDDSSIVEADDPECQNFFLLDGRSVLHLPDTWIEGRKDFQEMCELEGFNATGCQMVERKVFDGRPRDATPMNAEAAFCERLETLGAASLSISDAELSRMRQRPEAMVAAAEALLLRGGDQLASDGAHSMDSTLQDKALPGRPVGLISKGYYYYHSGGGYGYGYGGGGGAGTAAYFFMLIFFSIWNSAMAFGLCAGPWQKCRNGEGCGTLALFFFCPHVLVGFFIPFLVGGPLFVLLVIWPYFVQMCKSYKTSEAAEVVTVGSPPNVEPPQNYAMPTGLRNYADPQQAMSNYQNRS